MRGCEAFFPPQVFIHPSKTVAYFKHDQSFTFKQNHDTYIILFFHVPAPQHQPHLGEETRPFPSLHFLQQRSKKTLINVIIIVQLVPIAGEKPREHGYHG